MKQTPTADDFLLKWRGDELTVTLTLDAPRPGRAALRTNLLHAKTRRREIIAETERGEVPLARAWTDIPLDEVSPGVFQTTVRLEQVGVFSGKTCFFPCGSSSPEWPEGKNFHVKVESAETRANNSIYCVFPRQFGSFREVMRRLPHIMDTLGFRIVQTLPPFPVPTTYAVMGAYGCPFAATDFLSVDPAMAEFDEAATPLDQFKELIGAVHARDGLFFVDLPANHTGWASTLQTHHPDWFRREPDGRFHSPGAWGVKWADLVELDYANAALRAYMAEVFLHWCRLGVDGFRCDAGYMIPLKTWEYIVAKVREEYPDTVFLLEGLGGKLKTTDALLAEANLDWAYSEIFQTYDRNGFSWYLPNAIARAERYGALVHFAETHDNDRLAKKGFLYARLRVQLAALLSWQGAWGIANGVEWYATEKIDVHGKNDLNWGAPENMVALIAKLNLILRTEPSFAGAVHLTPVTAGMGNTLAVLRTAGGSSPLLVVANLDCENPATVSWATGVFPSGAAIDLVTGRTLSVADGVALAPGEVLCLRSASAALVESRASAEAVSGEKALFHIVLPQDEKRAIVVPAHVSVTCSADVPFRLRVVDPATGRTLRVLRSYAARRVVFTTPHYEGDGTCARALSLEVSRYVAGRAVRSHSRFLVTPPSGQAAVRLEMSAAEIRRQSECRGVLSNGAGAAAQIRAGWGEIFSQYDAFLAANPSPTVPSDRINVWTRTRCWLQREGYTRELDRRCQKSFAVDPAGRLAVWRFSVPCGLGLEASFVFSLSLAPNENAALLSVSRVPSGAREAAGSVRLVFRPDFEWRSFHATTKAYRGLEPLFAAATRSHLGAGETYDGFDFAPYGSTFAFRVSGGAYHPEIVWSYNVAHPEEAARGQEGAGDLFSPGWVSADLKVGETVSLFGSVLSSATGGEIAIPQLPRVDIPAKMPLEAALRQALDLYLVRRDDLKTVIAGYPWFLDWGRDTFIFLRGLMAAGRLDESRQILKAFAAFEEKGTLPNIIYGNKAGNRDTTDAPLWFIRCVRELEEFSGKKDLALRRTCASIVENYAQGTPNGIRVDPKSALVWSPSHFTWMDTNYPACTPRVGYPVEIQALWISALTFLGRGDLAARALASVKTYFKIPPENLFDRAIKQSDNQAIHRGYYDCLAAPKGECAAEATPEDTLRPNQLFLITLGVLDDYSILDATEELLIPGAIRSLNAAHPLYRGAYAGDEDTARKPAYHNGTAWCWPFPLYAEALVRMGRATREEALSLLASAVENLNAGALGHLSEIADGDSPHAQKGCLAQAWSDSELLRVWCLLSREEGR